MRPSRSLLVLVPLAVIGCVLPSYEATSSGPTSSSSSGTISDGGQGGAAGAPITGGGGSGGTAGGGGSPCGDTSQDPNNCGSCGNKCPGGLCVGGMCEIEVLQESASMGKSYGHIVADGQTVYWTSSGAVLALPTSASPGDAATTLFDGADAADFLAVDGVSLYFTSFTAGKVYGCTKGDCQPMPLAAGENAPIGLAIRGTSLYWATYVDSGHIRELGGGSMLVNDLSPAGWLPFSVVTDGTDIYWTYRGQGDDGGVRKAGMASFIDLAGGQPAPTGLAVDDTDVYWLGFDGSLSRAPKAGGGPITPIGLPVGDKVLFAGDVVVDATHVYWPGPGLNTCATDPPCACGPSCGAIWRAQKSDPVPEVFAQGDWGNVAGIAADDQHIYWTTGSDARLLRKAK